MVIKASLVTSLAIGTTFLLSPISSILVDKLGIRKTAFLGGFIATLGMFLSSFAVEKVSDLSCDFGYSSFINYVDKKRVGSSQ